MDPLNPVGWIRDDHYPPGVVKLRQELPAIAVDQGDVFILVGGYNFERFYNRP